MSDVPLLVSADEMLRIAELQLAAIRFDHLSIVLKDNAPQAGIDREDSESTPIEIDCKLGTRILWYSPRRSALKVNALIPLTKWTLR